MCSTDQLKKDLNVTSYHFRPFACNRDGLEKLCPEQQLPILAAAIHDSCLTNGKCPLCTNNVLNDSDCDLVIGWTPDFTSCRWRLGKVSPCCRQCAQISNLETVLNLMLAVDDDESEEDFGNLARHFQAVNRTDEHTLQLALNLSHAIKVLARQGSPIAAASNFRALHILSRMRTNFRAETARPPGPCGIQKCHSYSDCKRPHRTPALPSSRRH